MRLLSFLAALPLAIGPTLAAVKVRADNRVLNTDLAFHFVCKDKDRSSLEEAMETFLRNEHFRVLNKGRNQREHGVFLLDLDVVGIDDGQNIIEFDALPRTDGRYSAGLNTPPPTRRNPQLEQAC
jgi:hypothetical protein